MFVGPAKERMDVTTWLWNSSDRPVFCIKTLLDES